MTVRTWGGTWNPETGQLTFAFAGMSQIEAMAVLRLAEHALVRQMTAGLPGRPGPGPPGEASGAVRAPGLVVRRADGD